MPIAIDPKPSMTNCKRISNGSLIGDGIYLALRLASIPDTV